MSFKIVDTFFGADGGPSSFFGICDEDRDLRRFETYEEAYQAIQDDEEDASLAPPSKKRREPLEDRWRRRFMNLNPVPSHFKWCCGLGDLKWEWQEAYAFEFDGPLTERCLRYSVFLGQRLLGQVEKESGNRPSWTATAKGNPTGTYISAYEAACALLGSPAS